MSSWYFTVRDAVGTTHYLANDGPELAVRAQIEALQRNFPSWSVVQITDPAGDARSELLSSPNSAQSSADGGQ
jgi:hypothetical protein